MADAKIRLKHKPYIVEVNDSGDTIVIDPADMNFVLRFQKSYENIRQILDSVREKADEMEKSEEEEKQASLVSMMNDMFNDIRSEIDAIFGKDTSLKVFGESNWITMFDEFFEALMPVLEKSGMTDGKTVEASIEAKYGSNGGREL